MASEREHSSKLSETLSMIEEVKKQELEINRILGLIEEKRNKPAKNHSKSSSQDDETLHVTDETLSSTSMMDTLAKEGSIISGCGATVQEKPKGILKSPNLGSKDSFGFIEPFPLNENNVMYGTQLRRKKCPINQDNRLCLRFGFEPNLGCIYTKPELTERPNARMENLPVGVGRQNVSQVTVIKPTLPGGSAATGRQLAPSSSTVPNLSSKVKSDQRTSEARPVFHFTAKPGAENADKEKTTEKKTGDFITEWNNLLKPLGLDLGDVSIQDWIGVLTKKLSEGDLRVEDLMSIQQKMVENLRDLCHQSGDASAEHLVSELQTFTDNLTAKMKAEFENKEPDKESEETLDNNENDVETATHKPPSPVESQATDEVEPVYIDLTQWEHYAKKELEHGKYAREIREKGMDTIFCLDVSSSMKGAAWDQAKEFITNFIDGIQNSNLGDSVYEHVALVTFGGETRVQQHLTCDYLEIIRKLDGLKPEGPSPLYAGLHMCQAAILGAGATFSTNGYKIHPRVFLITDGKATAAGLVIGPDKYTTLPSIEELFILGEVKSISDKFHINVNPVPVGSFELSLLEKIATASKGKIVSPSDWRLQSKSFKNYLVAASIKRSAFSDSPEIFQLLVSGVVPDTSPEDMAQMVEFLRTQKQEVDSSDDDEVAGLPPLGTRIRRLLPGIRVQGQIGTVTKHFTNGNVGVTWDEALPNGCLHEQLPNIGVTVVNEPRVLNDELIAIGCRVQRGSDWRYDQQDGGPGNYGNVIVVQQNGVVKVRWDKGGTNSYRFGAEGKFDVDIVQGERQPKKAAENIVIEALTEEEAERKHIQELNERNKAAGDRIAESDRIGATGHSPSVITKLVQIEGHEKGQKSDEKQDVGFSRSKEDKANDRGKTSEGRNKPAASDMLSASHSETGNVEWMWKDGEQWIPYPLDVNEKIESNYVKHPTGTCVIEMCDKQFRIVFTQMKQINVVTRDKIAIKRSM